MGFSIVSLVLLLNGCFAQVAYPEGGGSSGSRCVTKTRESGNCRRFLECPAAQEDIYKGIYPTICSYGFGGIRSISVCCPNRDIPIPTEDHFAKFADVCGRASTTRTRNMDLSPSSFVRTALFVDSKPKPKESLSRIIRQVESINPLRVETFIRPSNEQAIPVGEPPSVQDFVELLKEQEVKTLGKPSFQERPFFPLAQPNYRPAVVGGVDAQRNAWPWMVLLGKRQGSQYNWFCGGALITDRHILTAAHCFDRIRKPDVVRLGEHDLSKADESPHIDVPASAVYRHEGFSSPAVANDIAIVKLRSPVTFTQYIRPICMPLSDVTPSSVGTHGTIIGWGTLSFGGRSSNILQEVSVPIVDKGACQAAYRRSSSYNRNFPRGFPNNLFCASEEQGGKDACQGDSGGPFMINDGGRFRVAGVVSAGQGCGSKTYPGLYTWVFHYLDWMQETVAK